MKLRKSLLLLLVTPLLLTSCSKNSHAIKAMTNFDLVAELEDRTTTLNYYVDVTADQYINLAKGKASFIFFVYSPGCSSCQNVKEHFGKYLKVRNYLIYSYDITRLDSQKLTEYDPVTFPTTMTVPKILIVKDGVVRDSVNEGKFSNYSFFKGAIDSFTYAPKLSFAITSLGINKFQEVYPNGEIVSYHSENQEETETIYNNYYNAKTLEKDYLLVDLSLASEDLSSFI